MGLNITRIGQREWFLDVRLRRAGKEQRRRETIYGTQVQAQERYLDIKRELKQGANKPITSQQKCFREILRMYREKSPPFALPHECRYNQLTRFLGDASIQALPDRLEAWIKALRSSPSRIGKPLANASVNRLLQMVNAAINLAVRLEVLEKNPITRARFPKLREVPRDKVLTKDEANRLLSLLAIEAPHLKPIFQFAYQVPCRKAELVNMRREDLDLPNNAIRVRNGTTKNDQGVWKPIPPSMAGYFRSIPQGCPFLFHRIDKGVYRPLGDFKTAWKRCLRLAGIEDFHFHDTRHVSASALLDNGTPEQVVMQVAGWKTNMLRTYYHRAGKQALGLVRFPSGSGRFVDTVPHGESRKGRRKLG